MNQFQSAYVDRRNDVGTKTTVAILTGLVGVFTALFIHATWAQSSKSVALSEKNSIDIAVIQARYSSIQSDLEEIKSILKRSNSQR